LAKSDDISDLLGWAADEGDLRERFVVLTNHPRFPEAARVLATKMIGHAEKDPAFDGVHKDAGRFIAGCWAVSLHASGGLSLPRLKAICASSGVMSPGRARAILQFLLFLRYIEPLAPKGQGTTVHYAPTAAMLDGWGTVVRLGLEAARIVEPAIDLVLARLDDPAVLTDFMGHLGSGFLPAVTDQPFPEFLRVFVYPHAGMQLIDLLVMSTDTDDELPARRPIAISINATAQRLRVSRAHIRRLLDRAETEGLLTRQKRDGTILLTDTVRSTIRYAMALRLYGFLLCGAKTGAALAKAV
jgi:hypothetical protein